MTRPFRYLADPLFLACVAAYVVNRLILKPQLGMPFLRDHLNDLICIPVWVPIMLWLQRTLGLRPGPDDSPRTGEILIPLIVWSAVFEIWLPRTAAFGRWCTADPADVLYYSVGALGAAIVWRGWYRRAATSSIAEATPPLAPPPRP